MISILFFSAASFFAAFLLGSIPWGVVISRVFYKKDIRDYGSGNIGTTNAYRTMGMVGGTAVFVLDFMKGMLSGWLALVFAVMASVNLSELATTMFVESAQPLSVFGYEVIDNDTLYIVTTHAIGLVMSLGLLGCMCGHIFSPWLNFKGGKGIAVAAGCMYYIVGLQGLLVIVGIFALLTITTRYVSVGSISAAIAAPIVAFVVTQGEPCYVFVFILSAALTIWAHRGNIARLRAGNENRIGARKAAVTAGYSGVDVYEED